MPKERQGELTEDAFWKNPDTFWQYGGDSLWGKQESMRLQSVPGALPKLGVLPCEHAPTPEDIENDPELAESILYSIGQLCLLHGLASIIKPFHLDRAGVTLMNEPKELLVKNGTDKKGVPQPGGLTPKGVVPEKKASSATAVVYAEPSGDVPEPFEHRAHSIARMGTGTCWVVSGASSCTTALSTRTGGPCLGLRTRAIGRSSASGSPSSRASCSPMALTPSTSTSS